MSALLGISHVAEWGLGGYGYSSLNEFICAWFSDKKILIFCMLDVDIFGFSGQSSRSALE